MLTRSLEGRRFDAYQIQLKNEKGELVQLKGAPFVQVVVSLMPMSMPMNANRELQQEAEKVLSTS